MEYTPQYFIDKFEAIPDEEIGTLMLERYCILWHCGVRYKDEINKCGDYVPTEESTALIKLFGGTKKDDFEKVYTVNDSLGKQGVIEKLRSLIK